jgi:asparagine N-glycosylation enzyme membrane subunit Stt3
VYAAFLGGLPRWLPLVVVAALMAAGLLVGGVIGAVFLVVVAGLAGWLAVLSWDGTPPAGRALRLAVIVVLLVIAARQALPD